MADLLGTLRQAGADEQAAALASRAAAHAPLDRAHLSLMSAFGAFEHEGLADQYRFGREADGAPAKLWGWEDLD